MTSIPLPLEADPGRELFTRRCLPFARDVVFRAWTEPALLAAWWGPHGFRSTFQVFEPRPGGEWRHVMHGPDGRNYDNYAVFRVVEPDRVEIAHVSDPRFDLIATFTDSAGGTEVTFLQRFRTNALCDALAPICEPANEQNLDRLTSVLASLPTS